MCPVNCHQRRGIADVGDFLNVSPTKDTVCMSITYVHLLASAPILAIPLLCAVVVFVPLNRPFFEYKLLCQWSIDAVACMSARSWGYNILATLPLKS